MEDMRLIWMLVLEGFGVIDIREVFDVRVFNSTASSYRNTAVASLYKRFEWEKQRRYEQRSNPFKIVVALPIPPLVENTKGVNARWTGTNNSRLLNTSTYTVKI